MNDAKEKPAETGSKTLNERVAAVGVKPEVPVVDVFTGKKACHRFMIPIDVQTPQPDKLNPRIVNIKVDAHMAHVSCIGEKCALFNSEAKECWDVSERKSQVKIAALVEMIDAHNRMHTHEG